MAEGLGLQSALRSYTQGVAWKQGQEQIARQQAQQQAMDEANKAATGVIDQSKAEWALNGAQGEYRPNSQTMFRAAEARGAALSKAGLWDQFLENEARIAPMRLRTRADAMQQYQVDGDVDKLARQVYPTLFDGKTIQGSERIEGAEAVAGLPARSSKLKLKLSDGTEHVLDPQQLVAQIKMSLDPDALKREAMLNFERAKANAKAEADIIVEREKGGQARQTEGVKGENKRRELDINHDYGLQLADVNNASAEKRADTSASATRYSADQGLKGRKYAADSSAGASRYSADQGLSAAGIRAKNGGADGGAGGGKRDQVFDQIHDELIRGFGEKDPMSTSSTKLGDEYTVRAARYAQDLVEKEGMSMRDALLKAGAELKKRRPPK